MKLMNRSKLPYSVTETEEQIDQIKDLMQLRKAAKDKDEQQRFSDSIGVSQEVLIYMQEENQRYSRRKELKRLPNFRKGK